MIVSQQQSAQELARALSARLGGIVSDVEPIRAGAAHRMFTAQWQQSDETLTPIVIRFTHGSHAFDEIRLETEALRDLKRIGYPVPEVFDLIDDEQESDPYLVMERLPGQAMTEVALAQPERIPYWLERASDLLLRLHGLDWRGSFQSLQPPLPPLDFAERQIRWWQHQAKRLSGDNADTLREPIGTGFEWLRAHVYRLRSGAPPTLVHRDFHSSNILVENDRITGVVDWSELTIADPAVDVAWTHMILSTASQGSPELGTHFLNAYMRRNPSVRPTLSFWQIFAACRRLTTIATILAGQSEQLAMWSEAPEIAQLAQSKDVVCAYLQSNLAAESED